MLGKAKVMSYEDLEEARAKRAKKATAKEAEGKGKRGQKCQSATPDEAITDKANVAGSAQVLCQRQMH